MLHETLSVLLSLSRSQALQVAHISSTDVDSPPPPPTLLLLFSSALRIEAFFVTLVAAPPVPAAGGVADPRVTEWS